VIGQLEIPATKSRLNKSFENYVLPHSNPTLQSLPNNYANEKQQPLQQDA